MTLLETEVRKWRGDIPARVAAPQLGIPVRTWQNIEAGRGFPYPDLLRLAMQTKVCQPEPDQAS